MQYMQEVRLFIGSSGRDRKANEDGHFHLRDRKKKSARPDFRSEPQ